MKQTAFEHEVCSRCGGCGRYSFNLMYGDVCFKCHGRGFVFTKRGAAASEYYRESLMKPAGELNIGECVRIDPVQYITAGGWGKVSSITSDCVEVVRDGINGREVFTFNPGEKVRYQHTDEEKIAKTQKALEYQASLTKQGTPRKVRV